MKLTLFTLLTTLLTFTTAAPAITPANNLMTDPPMACYNIYCNPEVFGDEQCLNHGCGKCTVGVNKCAST
ncbi:hypothetical protein M409DRAFT_25623 [Zasmidium cellare ATCC 36951]|uniref:Uncharacterized protein n=1 Tax=Zasmidium cellare ATCC 36951 TaxID=1080233 RepID=A0A6A6CCD0_ZASCE|nr:uncharacterized protein M409DRAFT_25623 [Zasmidium cellare ATCC 36951]KAF2163848.1 hypothetical protein M409DRAFT_25623 [Zasmidium cellare ATCC 36951]